MKTLSTKLREAEGGVLLFHCPGCSDIHSVRIAEGFYYWNGNVERPTFSPSIRVHTGHYSPAHQSGAGCWCAYNAAHKANPSPYRCVRCHSIVHDGKISFESDSTHVLAGLSQELPDWPLEDI